MIDDPNHYCSLPRLFGKKFTTWFEGKFSDACHRHDMAYGSLHPKIETRGEADLDFFHAINDEGHFFLAFIVWIFLRLFGWTWYKKFGST